MPTCLTLSIIRYGSRVKRSNPGKGVVPSPTPWCSKLSKREPSGHPRLLSPTLLIIIIIHFLSFRFHLFSLYYYFTLCEFFTPVLLHCSLCDSKFPQLSRAPLSNLADLNNIVDGLVSFRPSISNFSSPHSKTLGTVSSTLSTGNITIILIFHSFLSSLAKSM